MSDSAAATAIAAVLDRVWPDPGTWGLIGARPWDVLAAAILTVDTHPQVAQRAVAILAEHHADLTAVAELDHRLLAPRLRPLIGYQAKARALVEAARAIVRDHGGVVPRDPEELARVPGVGRVVAAMAADAAFGIPGIVSTRTVCRVVQRLGWSTRADSRPVSSALAQYFTSAEWARRGRQLDAVAHDTCRRAVPRCGACALARLCATAQSPATAPSSASI